MKKKRRRIIPLRLRSCVLAVPPGSRKDSAILHTAVLETGVGRNVAEKEVGAGQKPMEAGVYGRNARINFSALLGILILDVVKDVTVIDLATEYRLHDCLDFYGR